MGAKNRLSLSEVQDLQFAALCFFADFCDAHQLRYALFGGTLLGAVRHNGFIPWDDDVDVCMPRPDYDRFIRLAVEEDLGCYKVESYKTPFIKLVDVRYGFEERLLKEKYREESLFIDIFPVDGVPQTGIDSHFRRIDSSIRKLVLTICDPSRVDEGMALKRVIKKTALLLWRGDNPDKYLQMIDEEARRIPYQSSEKVSCCVWGWGYKDISNRVDFEKFVKLSFRDRQFWCQGNYEESLRLKYGDYMTPPPESARQHEHGLFWKR